MKFLLKVLAIILFYIIIFKPEFKILPGSVSVSFGILGVCFYLMLRGEWKRKCRKWMGVQPVINSILPFVFIAFIAGGINSGGDWYFVKYGFSVLLSFFACFPPIYFLLKIYGNVKFDTVLKYIVVCNYIYILIALVMFLVPSIRDSLLSLLEEEEGALAALERTEGSRLQAFGRSFFNAGVIEGFYLIFTALCIRLELFRDRWNVFLWISLAFFFVFGIMFARTAFIGAVIALIVLIPYFRKGKNQFVFLLSAVLIIAIVGSVTNYNTSIDKDFGGIFEWTFEAFVNYKNYGSFETHSTSVTISMFNILPHSIKTWLLGDGLWMDPSGRGYYMGTDVGWVRMIFSIGVIGTLAMLFYFYKTLKLIFVKHLKPFWGNKGRIALFSFLLYTLLINLKGFADIFYLCILFYYCECSIKLKPHKI